jgi:PKD repeat protein
MKKFLFIALLSFMASSGFAQVKCMTDYYLEKNLKEHPEYQAALDRITIMANNLPQQKTNGAVRIIPVVFHVLHQYGSENISKAQIEDQIRILNEDYSRMNADTVKTRSQFKSVAVSCDIEFRLARIDPNGNCTEGIDRIYSSLTNNADDNSKLNPWPSTKYFNVWVVKSIADMGQGTGTILGYAQFPGAGAASKDGVVIRNDCVGHIGTALSGIDPISRTLTHEAGHWLGLFHTFQGGCGGNGDQVSDTPPTGQANFGCNLNLLACDNTTKAMIENYMDYSDGNCQNMFTAKQKARMDGVLASSRATIISSANLAATGVDGNGPPTCAPIVDFYAPITAGCTGANFSFTDLSYNGVITNWNWTFNGASVPTSITENPNNVSWSTPGTYNVTLVASNTSGNNAKTRTNYITIYPLIAVDKLPVFEGFESTNITTDGWAIDNGGASATWFRNTSSKHSGAASFEINHYTGTTSGDVDAFYSKSYNFTNISKPVITFYTAYAQKASGVNDLLKLYISTDCGQTWQAKWTKSGSTLAGGTAITGNSFVPTAADWKLQTLDLSSYAGEPNMRFRFESLSREGNNLYIDDINIINTASGIPVQANPDDINMSLYPNPFTHDANIKFNLNKPAAVSIRIVDMLGNTISFDENKMQNAGKIVVPVVAEQLDKLAGSVYLVYVTIDGMTYTQKLIRM